MKKDEWKASDGIQLELAAVNAVRCEKNTLVIAGPGAGKTELLAQKAGYLFNTETCRFPKKILAISFKKDAADNLKERVVARYGEKYKDRFISLTYDAFFKNILDRFYNLLPSEYEIDSNYDVDDKNDMLLKAFIFSGNTDLAYMKESMAKRTAADIIQNTRLPINDIGIKNVWDIMSRGNDKCQSALTFQMIAELALYILQTNQLVIRILRATFSHVFLDEFQDTTDIQYDIVKALFMNTDVNLTAVGDRKQRIMVWAGARRTIFEDFVTDFNSNSFNLLMNHRSAPRLVELQKNMYAILNDNPVDISASSDWEEDSGEINLIYSDNEKVEAEYLEKMIKADIQSGIKPKDIAILCKQKVEKYTSDLVSVLRENDIYARVENEYQDLLKDGVISIILGVILLSFERKSPKEWEYIQEISEKAFVNEDSLPDSYIKMLNRLEKLFVEIHDMLVNSCDIEDYKLAQVKIVDFFGEDRIKAIFPEYSQGTYLSEKLERFAKLFWKEHSVSNDWKNAIKGFRGENSIPIMTVHKSKGLEYSSVYFVGLEDSAFWNFKKQPEEERCAFFVALSRAKKKVTFTYCSYRYNVDNQKQKTTEINEFYELLMKDNVANVIVAREESL